MPGFFAFSFESFIIIKKVSKGSFFYKKKTSQGSRNSFIGLSKIETGSNFIVRLNSGRISSSKECDNQKGGKEKKTRK